MKWISSLRLLRLNIKVLIQAVEYCGPDARSGCLSIYAQLMFTTMLVQTHIDQGPIPLR